MADLEQTLQEADRKLDLNDFAGAREGYRAAALIAPPSLKTRYNLRVAEDQDLLAFRQSLSRKYPNCVEVRLMEASTLLAAGRATDAAALCSELLARFPDDPKDRFGVHLLRFRAAVKAESFDTLVDDFEAIWHAADAHAWARRYQPGLFRTLAEIRSADAIPALRDLAGSATCPPIARRFLLNKVQELQALSDIFPGAGESGLAREIPIPLEVVDEVI